MRRTFSSATLKLTAWYLINLIIICLIFSFIIFEISSSEISSRLERLQIRVEGSDQTITLPGPVTLSEVRMNQADEARESIFIGLLYLNMAVITLGGFGSYVLARRTLKPIEQAHEAQSRFTSDASHELRTPLAVMKSEIQVALKDTTLTSKDYKELLESNLEEVDKLTELSQSLLQLSRLEHDDIDTSDRIDVERTLRAAVRRSMAPADRFILNMPRTDVVIDGNQSMITDLFHILIDNAIKYSPKTSPIDIAVSTNGRTCKITIINEGEGIPKADLSKIFERFYRSGRSLHAGMIDGYGLGLSLAKKIVNLHDGSIAVASAPNKSTNFTIALPQVRKNH